MKISYIEDTIGFLNADILDTSAIDFIKFSLEADGCYVVVKFLGTVIWSSEDDMREMYEDGVKESLSSYLQREALALISQLRDIQF